MDAKPARRRLAAILSCDAVDYSARMAADDVATVETLRSHRDTIRGLVADHHGRVVDAIGDNLLAEFASAVDAVACAIATQERLGEHHRRLDEARRLPFRIGLHLGDVLFDEAQIYGDGVNVAARLEAQAEPGGILASGAIVEQVRGKLEAGFTDLGERELKGIPGAVRSWRVQAALDEEATPALTVPGFGGRPAIAVLPFENRSGDPEQAYLVDGIVEDVIARLSAFRSFPVLARSSTFTYKGTGADARRVSRELGARYIVEGSVRRVGSRVRVGVQLIDGSTGHQMQAERYDRELDDVFALQDEIVDTLVGAIEPTLRQAERRRAATKPTASLDAWEAYHRALPEPGVSVSWDEAVESMRWFRRAIELDPGFAAPYARAALTLWAGYQGGRLDDLGEGVSLAETSIRLAPEDPLGHLALGLCLSQTSGTAAGLRACERAVELNPSHAPGWAMLSHLLAHERPEEALAMAERALRLSPRDPAVPGWVFCAGVCCFCADRYDEAVRRLQDAIERGYAVASSYRVLGAALGHCGRPKEAREAIDAALRRDPDITLARLRERNSPQLVERLLEGWKKAGWSPPEA